MIENIVTEQGQTYVAQFTEDGHVLLALGVEEPHRDLTFAVFAFEARTAEALEVGLWLDREYQEGRAAIISAYFEVNV